MTRMDDIRAVHQDHQNPYCDACYLLAQIALMAPNVGEGERRCPACGGRKGSLRPLCAACTKAGNEAPELFRG